MNLGDVLLGVHSMIALPRKARTVVAGILLIILGIIMFREEPMTRKADYRTLANKLFDDGQTHRAAQVLFEWYEAGGMDDPWYYITSARFQVKNGNMPAAERLLQLSLLKHKGG